MLELGTYYAAPYGATLLTDLGARVIKIEQLDGDPIRHILPFPEVGAIKVLQGKESIAVDIATDEGREIVLELVRRADAVLQSFRAGVAERLGYTAADLLAVNPDLVYLNAPGYGVGPPCGHRPAYAPTIGAASGLAYRNVGGVDNVPQRADFDLESIKRYSLHMNSAAMGSLNADPLSAVSVGTALVLGLLARRRGAPGQAMLMSMLSTMAHALSEGMVEYADAPELATPDARALRVVGALLPLPRVGRLGVPRRARRRATGPRSPARSCFPTICAMTTTSSPRLLAERFASRPADAWERELTALDVACVAVSTDPLDGILFSDLGKSLGVVAETTHRHDRRLPAVHAHGRSSRDRVASPVPRRSAASRPTRCSPSSGYSADRIEALRSCRCPGFRREDT